MFPQSPIKEKFQHDTVFQTREKEVITIYEFRRTD